MLRKVILLLLTFMILPKLALADGVSDLRRADDNVVKALEATEQGDLSAAKEHFQTYKKLWYDIEEGVKKQSKASYKAIEDAMGAAGFAFAKDPVPAEEVRAALQKLKQADDDFISGKTAGQGGSEAGGSVASLVSLLDQALADLDANDTDGAKAKVEEFRKSWLDIEGVVLTQSSKAYGDAERDMVTAYSKLSAASPDTDGAKTVIRGMRDYLAPLSGKTSYTMVDVLTILLREGLEALLVVVALLGFLNKSGHGDKKRWIWYGVGTGLAISVVLGVLVKLLFSSGAFGSNNFLIAGCTGLFAAVMLLYMSYWLHSKSSLSEWRSYIGNQSTKALASGSLWSLAILSFLAVFREGTETVLFFIGMASSISMDSLVGGIVIGVLLLVGLSFLILKVGLKIPMRPFFLVSSLLVFYLCFKFLGMGVNSLQLAGAMPATHLDSFPSLEWLALYPTAENIVPQVVLLVAAIAAVLWNRRKDRRLGSGANPNHSA